MNITLKCIKYSLNPLQKQGFDTMVTKKNTFFALHLIECVHLSQNVHS